MFEDFGSVSRPGRYLGGEINSVVKEAAGVDLTVALAFPEVYEIGMSHLGLKILYGMINDQPRFWAERVMAPWVDLEARLRNAGLPITSLESGRPLGDFDVVGFSLQYELTFTNVINMLDLAGIPLLAEDRSESHPIIIGGGPCAFNPEPLADFFDLFYLGDAEAGFIEVLDEITDWKNQGGSKKELLASLADRPGIYVPSLFEPIYKPDGTIAEIKPLKPGYEIVTKALISDLDAAYFPTKPVVPLAKPVHDRISLEITRGCTRGCRFCQAGFLYRPVRERKPATIMDLAGSSLTATGMDEVSFLSLSTGDYSCLPSLMTAFMDRYADNFIALSLPSLRVKSLTSDLMKQIKRVRKTGFTIAPEAGTQRLRDVINKDLTDEDLITAAREAFQLDWRLIKLYFMIGLPTETKADVLAIADLARRVKGGARVQVNVSYATFVPKAHTPFQWEPMLGLDEMKDRMGLLRSALKKSRLNPKWNQPNASVLEGILARGDRRLGRVLTRVHKKGGRFEGWSEQLNPDIWYEAMAEENIDPADYIRARRFDEVLPWSHLSSGATSEFLLKELERAKAGTQTEDCRDGVCDNCGVCDFKEVRQLIRDPKTETISVEKNTPPSEPVQTVRINYSKLGKARFLSHLETVELFIRGFRRAGLNMRMSQGFHPKPKLVFASPLPVGLASQDEHMDVDLIKPPKVDEIVDLLKDKLPEGFTVQTVKLKKDQTGKLKSIGARFKVESKKGLFDKQKQADLENQNELIVEKIGKKGIRRVDLLPLLSELNVLTPNKIEITLLHGNGASIRIDEAVSAIFDLTGDQLSDIEPVKVETLF